MLLSVKASGFSVMPSAVKSELFFEGDGSLFACVLDVPFIICNCSFLLLERCPSLWLKNFLSMLPTWFISICWWNKLKSKELLMRCISSNHRHVLLLNKALSTVTQCVRVLPFFFFLRKSGTETHGTGRFNAQVRADGSSFMHFLVQWKPSN